MKYLKTYFEKNFNTLNAKGEEIRDGIQFEEFVKKILKCEYPEHLNFSVENTLPTHDGGKDFVIVSEDLEIWAECKNYENRLSLKNIANTLVFAHVGNINQILIFSYSKLNKNALDTICSFFKHDNKILRIYDDEALENLILVHYEELLKVQEDLPKLDSFKIRDLTYVTAQIYTLSLDKDNVSKQISYIPRGLEKISNNDIIGIDILIKNGSEKTTFLSKINFGTQFLFINLPDKTRATSKIFDCPVLPYEQKVFSSYYQISGLRENNKILDMPQITVTSPTGKVVKNISFGRAVVTLSDKLNFVGEKHEKFKEKINTLLEKESIRGVLLHGRSGTGKTRMQQEVLPSIAIKNIRILHLNIKEWDSSETTEKNFFSKFILRLFELPDDSDEQSNKDGNEVLKDFFGHFKNDESAKINELINAPQLLTQKSNIQLLYKILLQLSPESKICLVIDNLQFLSDSIIRFLYELAVLNAKNTEKFIFFWIINDDYLIEGGSVGVQDIKHFFSSENNYRYYSAIQFDDEDLALFIREVLRCNKNDDVSDITNLLKHYSYNPYILKSTLEWLDANGLISCRDNKYIVCADYSFRELFRSNQIADSQQAQERFLSPLKQLWRYHLQTAPDTNKDWLLCVSAVHFLGKLKKSDLDIFGISNKDCQALAHLHFLKFDPSLKSYIFDHDIVELSFTNSIEAAQELSAVFIEHLNEKLPQKMRKYSSFCQKYILLFSRVRETEDVSHVCLDEIKMLSVFDGLPSNLEREYLDLHSRYLLKLLKIYPNKIDILSIFRTVASSYRERIGSEFLIRLYNGVYAVCREHYEALVACDIFGWFTIEYCNLLADYGDLSTAKTVIEEIIGNKFYADENLNNKFLFLKACFLNRLGGYLMKLPEFSTDTVKISEKFDQSLHLADILEQENDDWAAEIKFINYTDKGYLNYFDKNHSDTALGMFKKAAAVFKEKHLWQKTMNDFLKRLMIAMIDGRYDEAVKIADEGIAYCYTGTYHYYDGFFMEHYLVLQASTYLMRKAQGDIRRCLDNLKRIQKTDAIIKLNFSSMINQLEGICAFYNGKEREAMNKFLDAYLTAKQDKSKINYKPRLEQLKFNIIKLNDLVYDRQLEPMIFERNESNKDLHDVCDAINKFKLQRKQIGKPNGIFTEYENKFNLPFI